jgi:acyl-CoA thioester hydrolase
MENIGVWHRLFYHRRGLQSSPKGSLNKRMPTLSATTDIKVRFSEVDSIKFVWHGHYLKYFEEGREAFGAKYGIGYQDIFDQGLITPLVNVNCNFKRPLEYGDTAVVETTFIDTDSAKIIFEFVVRRKSNDEVCATGSSIQVFLNDQRELLLTPPNYFMAWKKKWGLLP